MDVSGSFSTIFTEAENFHDFYFFCTPKPFGNGVHSQRYESAPGEHSFFILEKTPILYGGQNFMTELSPFNAYPFPSG